MNTFLVVLFDTNNMRHFTFLKYICLHDEIPKSQRLLLILTRATTPFLLVITLHRGHKILKTKKFGAPFRFNVTYVLIPVNKHAANAAPARYRKLYIV